MRLKHSGEFGVGFVCLDRGVAEKEVIYILN
jgi:hypothetical protein